MRVAVATRLPTPRPTGQHLHSSLLPPALASRLPWVRPYIPSRSASTAVPSEAQRRLGMTLAAAEKIQHLRSLLDTAVGGDQFWSDRLEEALADLQPRKSRIALYGDPLAAPEDVVSALLQTPFSDSSEISTFISKRKGSQEAPDILRFEFNSEMTRESNRLLLPSGWLRQTGVDLYEILGTDALPHLLRADVIALVVDPFRLLATLPLPAIVLQRSIIIVNGHLPPNQTTETVSARIRATLGPDYRGRIIFSDAGLALRSYDTLRSDGSSPSPSTVSAFQEQFLASGVGHVQRYLAESAKHTPSPPSDLVVHLASQRVRDALLMDNDKSQQMLRTIKSLQSASETAAIRARHASVAHRQIDGGRIQGSVQSSETDSAARIAALFSHRLSWISLLFRLRVDDVAAELERSAGAAFADVEHQLVYEAGQLYQMQKHLSKEADYIIRQTEPPFGSAILTNRLSTLSLSIPPVEAHSLVTPIHLRRQQLVTEIIPRIQARARGIFYQTYLGATGGVAASWLACVPPLELVSTNSAVGLGLLSVLASVWSGQSRWDTAQRGFWQSWKRCTDMLAADIRTSFSSAVDTLVVAKPKAAAEGLEELARKRLQLLVSLEARLDSITGDGSK